MERYKVTFDPTEDSEDVKGIYGISLVGEAANGFKFVALSKDKPIEVKMGNEEKRLLISPVLIPDQQIYRNWSPEGCTIEFSKEVIRKASQEFMKNGYHTNSKIDHEGDFVDGISVVETWIVEDPMMDKAKLYGFEVPEGTLMVTMKVDSDDLWNNYVKTGKVTGFSIDSLFGMEKILQDVRLSITNKKTKKTNMFNLFKKAKTVQLAVEFMEIEVEGLGKLWAESFETGQVVLHEVEGAQVPLVDGSFTYEGKTYKTDADGLIVEIVDEVSEVADEVMVEMKKMIASEFLNLRKELKLSSTDEVKDIVVDRADEIEDVLEEAKEDLESEDIQALKDRINELEALVNTLKGESDAVKEENVELKKAPAARKVSAIALSNVPAGSKEERRAQLFAKLK